MKKLTRKEKIKQQEQKSKLKKELEKYKTQSSLSKFFILFGLIFLAIFGNLWLKRNTTIEESELIVITGKFSHEVQKERRKTIGNYIKIQLIDYPNTKFKIGRFGSNSVKIKELNDQIKKGETLNVLILKSDFEKITKKKTIWVYGIKDDNNSYFDVRDYNQQKKKDRNSIYTYLLVGFSIWLILYGLRIQLKNKHPADNIR